MPSSAGTVLGGRWHLRSMLAAGGMGDIHLAHDLAEDREVAVKLLRGGIADGPRRFASEIAALERLQHPHIVSLLDTGDHGGVPYLVMQLVDGPSLAERLQHGALPLPEVERIGRQVADALACAHTEGVVHRDIKPSNVLFGADGDAHVADFGIARIAGATAITATGTAIGTASYVAPEQLTGEGEVGPAADIYSLGLVLLEAITGERCFAGSPNEAALARLSRDPTIPDDVPAPWRRLLRAMTAREPFARPSASDAADLLAAGLPLDRTATLHLDIAAAPPTGGPSSSAAGDAPTLPAVPVAATSQRLDDPAEPPDGAMTEPFDPAIPEPEHVAGTEDHGPRGTPATPEGALPSDPTERPGHRRLRRSAAAAGVLATSALVAVGAQGWIGAAEEDAADRTSDDAPATDLPEPLDDAFTRLHEEVQP